MLNTLEGRRAFLFAIHNHEGGCYEKNPVTEYISDLD